MVAFLLILMPNQAATKAPVQLVKRLPSRYDAAVCICKTGMRLNVQVGPNCPGLEYQYPAHEQACGRDRRLPLSDTGSIVILDVMKGNLRALRAYLLPQ